MRNEITWQQFRNDIKNKTFIHEGKKVTGWELPMNKQTRMYSDAQASRKIKATFVNSGVKNV
tara:strand:+ start:1029 stop:1214 length:186 start_codon:yes stop_codon:yes gene_type:complete